MRHASEVLIRELVHFLESHYMVHGTGWRADLYREQNLRLWRETYGDGVADRVANATAKLNGQPDRLKALW